MVAERDYWWVLECLHYPGYRAAPPSHPVPLSPQVPLHPPLPVSAGSRAREGVGVGNSGEQ